MQKNMLRLFSEGALLLLTSAVIFAQGRKWSADADSSKQAVINNYYYGWGAYFPVPVYHYIITLDPFIGRFTFYHVPIHQFSYHFIVGLSCIAPLYTELFHGRPVI